MVRSFRQLPWMRHRFGVADVIIHVSLITVVVVTLYPFLYVLSNSFSSPEAVLSQEVWLFPKGFSVKSYGVILSDPSIWVSYFNTVWYTGIGTALSIGLTVTAAYALSRRYFFARNFFMVVIIITMFFSGGLVPLFILVTKLGLYNTRWAIVLPTAMQAWNLIIARVYFQANIPDSLVEAAKIDGYNDIRILFRVVLPISAPIIAVVGLFTAVGYWNSYFPALIYLPDASLHPITMYLRQILLLSQMSATMENMGAGQIQRIMMALQIKYSVIIVAIFPILCLYPFLQRYFIKGMMIGALKG